MLETSLEDLQQSSNWLDFQGGFYTKLQVSKEVSIHWFKQILIPHLLLFKILENPCNSLL